jgi:hypothetical protein
MNTNPSVTPVVKLPRSVERQVRRVNDMVRERKAAADSPATGEDPTPAPAKPSDVPSTEGANTAPRSIDADYTAGQAPTTEDGRYWNARFRVTYGMIQKQRLEHNERLKTERDRVRELEQEVARLKDASGAEPSAAVDLSEFYTREEIDALGEEQARINANAAVKAAAKQVRAALDKELAPLRERERQEKDQRQTDEDIALAAYHEQLEASVPHWRDVDTSPAFLAWLTKTDAATGLVRQRLLNAAVNDLNAAAVARLIKSFELEHGKVDVPAIPPATPADGGSVGAEAKPPALAAQKPPTRAEIREHYKMLATKRGYEGSDKAKEFDARLKAATAAGLL